ncbi:MAG TPA: 2OG-Fe(II) oxygenase family protein, partial [Nitrospinaceae bacterium]|nr:2OG-Fe(II) oxygenase family protein [Nitrospinaceae bacterium]
TSQEPSPLRRLAIAAYFHDEWDVDWGGELILYGTEKDETGKHKTVEISECIAPEPRSLVIFTVPRFHRICRIDPRATDGYQQLSIETWFMTEH